MFEDQAELSIDGSHTFPIVSQLPYVETLIKATRERGQPGETNHEKENRRLEAGHAAADQPPEDKQQYG